MRIYYNLFTNIYNLNKKTEWGVVDKSVNNRVITTIGLISIIETINIYCFKNLEPLFIMIVFLLLLLTNFFVFYRNERYKEILKDKKNDNNYLTYISFTYLIISIVVFLKIVIL
jgi:uncharacterized membrane protein YidH (DUF202 family)